MEVFELKNPEPKLTGDPARHRTAAELEAGLRGLVPMPRDSGQLTFIVRRLADGTRETPGGLRLTPEDGVPGDRWGRNPNRKLDEQICVMQQDVAALIANGQPLALFGDSLFVALDLSTGNLPLGSRVRVGGAVLEVTPMPHNGCSKFKARFGADALRFVNAGLTRHLNLRGVYWKVVEAGDVSVGCLVEVVSRGGLVCSR